ncbi:MAG: hypothetical protein LUC43_08460 [Burkholderiales bacterium]|nr:hypothetical protein [Burkholderiales bacterium]
MARCRRISGDRCRKDHSSRAPQSPSLVSLPVIRIMLSTAFINMARRHISQKQGELSAEVVRQKDDYLAQWLTETFSGENPHFETGPEHWNPHGLSEHMRIALAPMRKGGIESFPEKDRDVLKLVFDLFKDQSALAVEDCLVAGELLEYPEQLPPAVDRFIETWSMLLVGAPVGPELN